MKKTRNRVYKKSYESKELFLFTINNGGTYWWAIQPICRAIAKKHKTGVFDLDKATEAFYRVANISAKDYWAKFCFPDSKWSDIFPVQCRYTVAVDLLNHYTDYIIELSKEMDKKTAK